MYAHQTPVKQPLNDSYVEQFNADQHRYLLVRHQQGWELRASDRQAHGPVRVDFCKSMRRFQNSRNHAELMIKAMGKDKPSEALTVLDATAGLGTDSFILASRGYRVLMMERCLPIAYLLNDGLQRGLMGHNSHLKTILGRLTFRVGDSVDYLSTISAVNSPDVVYLDPMFPETRKTALPNKSMQICRSLVGFDHDSQQLFNLALQKAGSRVIVKRPLKSDGINHKMPTFSVAGKLSRFDVYCCTE